MRYPVEPARAWPWRARVAAALAGAVLSMGCAHSSPPAGAVAAWRVGPLLEGARSAEGGRLLAVRPFFSRESVTDDSFRSVNDILWPVGSFRRRDDRLSWRCFPFYGMSEDDEPDGAYRFRLFPIYFEGRARDGEEYRALFPIYGSIRNLPLLGNVRFVLFPLYGESEVAGTHTRSVLWPLYTTRHGDNIDQLRLFPFWGEKRITGRHAVTSRFILWPFWSEAHFAGESVQGDAFVLFPIYGRTRLNRERGWTVLPPLISHTVGSDGYRRLNAPWPFVRQLDDGERRERHWWPFYGSERAPGNESWYACWPLVGAARHERRDALLERFYVAPLYYQERRTEPAAAGRPPACYRRLWPLFSWQRQAGVSQLRVLELNPFRHSAAVERNWAPFWSLFVRRARGDGARSTDLLWGLAAWGRDGERRPFGQFLWVFGFGSPWAPEGPAAPPPAPVSEPSQP
jgi:hypothetical protein